PGDLERAGDVRRMDWLLLHTRRGAARGSGRGLELHRFLPLRGDRLLGDFLETFLRLRKARLEAEAALELRLGGLEVAALELVEAGVIVREGRLPALQAVIRAGAGREEKPGPDGLHPAGAPSPNPGASAGGKPPNRAWKAVRRGRRRIEALT